MQKKIITLVTLSIFIFSAIGAYTASADTSQPTAKPLESTKDRVSRAMNNIVLGPTEVTENLDETKTKGTKIDRCSEKTRSGVERGIARLFAGVWQLATFWYSDPNAASTTGSTSTK